MSNLPHWTIKYNGDEVVGVAEALLRHKIPGPLHG